MMNDNDPNDNYKRKQKNIFEKYREVKDKLSILVFVFDVIFDFIEKLVSLLFWQNQKASYMFLVGLLLGWIGVTFFPIRYFVVLGGKLKLLTK